jgi:hypothetical protein
VVHEPTPAPVSRPAPAKVEVPEPKIEGTPAPVEAGGKTGSILDQLRARAAAAKAAQ